MEAPIPTPNLSIKNIEIEFEGKKFICKIQTIKDFLSISLEGSLKYEGYINATKIQNQIGTFIDYNIDEIFEEINLLENDSFSFVKEQEKYILKIKFTILRKDKYLIVDLEKNKNVDASKDDLICELKDIIKQKDEKIKMLEGELKKYKDENKSETKIADNNFDIKLKEHPICELTFHTNKVLCLILLNDGRIASCSYDKSIIIYNKNTYKPDLIIKEHSDEIYSLTQLTSGIIASCSKDKTIKLFNINGNNYNVLQTLSNHTNLVYKIIELKNKQLASCSADSSIIVYFKENNKYKIDYKIPTNGSCSSVVQTKNNEICYSEKTNNGICFFDIMERKKIKTIENISKGNSQWEAMLMITEDLLFVGGENKISIINVNQHNLIRVIDAPGSSWISAVCLLNENTLLTGDYSEIIKQWKIEGDNLILISKKEKTHSHDISSLLYLGYGKFASASDDKTIRIW